TLISPDNADPADKLQTENSIQAIGSGQLNGKGLYNGKLNQYNYLPEPQTDFIFSIIGEEFGFVGCSVIIGLILLLLLQCLWIARTAKDHLAKVIIGGIVGMIGIQTYVNIGVVTGVLPNTGLPLPFISAGISSLLTNMIAIGFVLNISMQRKSINE
nr:FtsW/RodA/SpoVE family cell cycle protein [Vallitaleaceae bacterium]